MVHTSKGHRVVCRLLVWAGRLSTTEPGAGGDTGWQSGTRSCSVGISAGTRAHRCHMVECCCGKSHGTGKSRYRALREPIHQNRPPAEADPPWRDAASSFGSSGSREQQPGWTETSAANTQTPGSFYTWWEQQPRGWFLPKLPLLHGQTVVVETTASHILFSSLSWGGDNLFSHL